MLENDENEISLSDRLDLNYVKLMLRDRAIANIIREEEQAKALASEKKLKEEILAEEKRLKEDILAEQKRLKEEILAEQKMLKEEILDEKKVMIKFMLKTSTAEEINQSTGISLDLIEEVLAKMEEE